MDIELILEGAYVMGYAIAGLFFLKFWHRTRDRLFSLFAVAFWILGLQRLMLAITQSISENSTYLFVIRLVAFLIILYAIWDKNMRAGKPKRSRNASA